MSIADIRNNGLNPLSYLGVQSYSPVPLVVKTINPTPNDSQNFTLGSMWLNKLTQQLYVLVSLSQSVATWVLLEGAAGNITTLRSQDGNNVTPTAGVINISGGNNLTTTGTVGPNTLTISLTGITQHSVQIGGAAEALTQLANGSTGQILTAQTGADPIWASPATGGTVTSITAATGITLTPNPIIATGTVGLTIPVVVSSGGTGATTLTNHSLLLGNGTSAVSGLGAAINGQIPIGSTGNAPVLATITAGSGISIANGAGSITISAIGGGGVVNNVYAQFALSATAGANLGGNIFLSDFTNTFGSSGIATVAPIAGTFSGLGVNVSLNNSTSNDTITLYKNGSATALTATITASTTGKFQDTTHTVSVAQGDLVQIVLSQSTTNSWTGFASWVFTA